jgi:hypothetical protein
MAPKGRRNGEIYLEMIRGSFAIGGVDKSGTAAF